MESFSQACQQTCCHRPCDLRSEERHPGCVFCIQAHETVRVPSCLRALDFVEQHNHIKCVVKDIIHDPGHRAPLRRWSFIMISTQLRSRGNCSPLRREFTRGSLCTTAQGPLDSCNASPMGSMPEGTMVCCLEENPVKSGKLAQASRNCPTIISHDCGAREDPTEASFKDPR